MNQDALPYPAQMRNSGSPPAHLSLSNPSNPSGWLQYKWMQPPLCAPDWVFGWVRSTPGNWIGHALRKDQQAAGLLLPSPLGGAILTKSHACQDAAYRHWKRAVDNMWEDERHCQQAEARQRLLDKHATHDHQEADCHQQLLKERASNERQEAARHQQFLDKHATCCQCLFDAHAAQA
jgi:hypothetical protein